MGLGYAKFVERMLAGGTTSFYDDLRWPEWEIEVEVLALDQGLSLWVPPS